jgi:hypothetical protein
MSVVLHFAFSRIQPDRMTNSALSLYGHIVDILNRGFAAAAAK